MFKPSKDGLQCSNYDATSPNIYSRLPFKLILNRTYCDVCASTCYKNLIILWQYVTDFLFRTCMEVEVKDKTGHMIVILFGDDAIQVIGVPLNKLKEIGDEVNNSLNI